MNFYVRYILVVLIVMAMAEFIPEIVNAFLVLLLLSMLLMNSGRIAALLKALNLSK